MCIKPACAWEPAAAGTHWAEHAERSREAERPCSCPCGRGNTFHGRDPTRPRSSRALTQWKPEAELCRVAPSQVPAPLQGPPSGG